MAMDQMRRQTGRRSLRGTFRRIVAVTLAFTTVSASNAWAGLEGALSWKAASGSGAYAIGDVNGDGAVDLKDTTVVLRAALNIESLTEEAWKAADLNQDGRVTLEDAVTSLKAALGIQSLPSPGPSFQVATKAPATAPPSATPKTTFAPVPPNALVVVDGEPMKLAEDAGEYQSAFVENYEGNQGMYGFYRNSRGVERDGMKVENPLAGRKDLVETVEQATSLDAPEGKVNVWTLPGASLEALPSTNEYPANADPRVTQMFNDEEVAYTIPKWTTGFTVSFWAKIGTESGYADPILTFTDENFMLTVRANGTVRFCDASDSLNQYDMGSSRIEPLGTTGEWNHYTVTIANDWIQTYVNGQECVFDKTLMLRSKMKTFNGGFLTRMNPVGLATEKMVNENERNRYYLTKIDSTSSYLNGRAPWYKNPITGQYEGHDEFSVFHNGRFRGANGNGTFLMKYLTQKATSLFVGGARTGLDGESGAHLFKGGALVCGLTCFLKELTPEQIASNYEYVAKENRPADVALPGDDPREQEPVESQKPTEPTAGATKVGLRKNGLGINATYDKTNNVYSFQEAKEDDDGKVTGVRLENPFAATREDDKSYLRETLLESLEGQEIFPYKYPEDYPDASLAGQYVAKLMHGDAWLGHGGCDRFSVEPRYGNFYDRYYGDVFQYGTEMTPPLANLEQGTVMSYEEVSGSALKVTEYHRPKWTKGATISFWAKPTRVDDSPLITFYAANKMLLTVDVMGSVCFLSLYATVNNQGDWLTGKVFQPNGKPRNTFVTYGDESYVHENQWNYYTITFANDWIQVYVNGEEMVYKRVNLNVAETKYFNAGYMTRRNPIGIWTTDMIAKYGDPSGKTAEGRERNYLTKAGFVLDTSHGYEIEDLNKAAGGASLRSSSVYENPLEPHKGSELLMDLMTASSAQLYLGGIDGVLKAENQFYLSRMFVSHEELASGRVLAKPITYAKEQVLAGGSAGQFPIYVDREDVLAVAKDAPGAYRLDGVLDKDGNEVYVSGPCKVLSVDGTKPESGYALERSTDVEISSSRRKIYSSDHRLAAGTQIADVETYYEELSPEKIKKLYEEKQKSMPAGK